MIPRECKRLIEVDFPLAKVSYHAAREKSIRHGHPSTLHLWWARRPLASCRAVLLGLLLPDPEDPHCPSEFKEKARALLQEIPGDSRGYAREGTDLGLRKALLAFIGEFANWDLSGDELWLGVARGLVQAAHPEEAPLVVDPFAGGGSIPLEALRLGCEAFASDLNPVACLILKVLLEDIPRHGAKLAQELREVGTRIKEEAARELADFYPLDPPDPNTGVRPQPIAYLWARTVRCEAPHCGAEIPLLRSFWLCKKPKKKLALRSVIIREKPSSFPPSPSGIGAGVEDLPPLSPFGGGAKGGDVTLPSPSGRGVGGEGHHGPAVIPPDLLRFARTLRQQQTDAETKLWFLVRDRRLAGWKFRRQHPIPPYIVDFYCHEAALVIEIDGGQHGDSRRADEKRAVYLEKKVCGCCAFGIMKCFRKPKRYWRLSGKLCRQATSLPPPLSPRGDPHP